MVFSDLEVIMKKLLDDGKYADMEICCQGHRFLGHRAIICSQSHFFEDSLKSGFREAESSQIDLHDDDVESIACVLSFCYLQDYGQADDWNEVEQNKAARKHLGVFIAADKFGLKPLQELAGRRIIDWVKLNWSAEYLPEVVQDMWLYTPPHDNGIRDTIVEIVSANILLFLKQDNGVEVFRENCNFMFAVLEQVARETTQS